MRLRHLIPVALALSGCVSQPSPMDEATFKTARERMVERDLRGRGVRDERVLEAMGQVPRHRFVPPSSASEAYADYPLPIGGGQTISQPYIVAVMTEQLHLRSGERVLEIGTGSGYQAAVLAQMGCEVYSVEIVSRLADEARERLRALGYDRVHVRAGDGYFGWPEEAPFDAAIITAAAPQVPQPIVDQLRPGGVLVLPLGTDNEQTLVRAVKEERGVRIEDLGGVAFVPMTGSVRGR